MRINKTLLDKVSIKQLSKTTFYRDDALKGFGLRVSPGGTCAFIVEKRVQGKVKRITLGTFPALTCEQARKAAHQRLAEMALGIDPNAQEKAEQARKITLEELLEDYLVTHNDLSPSTINDYQRHLRESFADWKRTPITQITKDMVERRFRQLSLKSKARANGALRSLRAWLNHAMVKYDDADGRSILPFNPVIRLSQTRAWHKIERRQTWIKPHQLHAWYQATLKLETLVTRDYLHFLLFTGLRKSEAASLPWEQVDFEDRSFIIKNTKNKRDHTLPMSDFVFDLLTRRHEYRYNEWVFPSTRSGTHLIEPKSGVRKVTEISGVEFSFHDLRRTFITVAESLDIPAYALKRLLNHKDSGDVTAGYIMDNLERL
ncbi:MAG: tyrosine-type recombinase/integrase, partial [Proteobacteria bacterium]|nr:tyrosine-type recombinase/integrase [Pseudomonadota bacterium]